MTDNVGKGSKGIVIFIIGAVFLAWLLFAGFGYLTERRKERAFYEQYSPLSSVSELSQRLDKGYEDFSLILADVREVGDICILSFGLTGKPKGRDSLTNEELIYRFPKETCSDYSPYVGKEVMAKVREEGGYRVHTDIKDPAGHFVGNPYYGRWERDSSGNSFWVWYGRYALFRDILTIFMGRPYPYGYGGYGGYGGTYRAPRPSTSLPRTTRPTEKKGTFGERFQKKRVGGSFQERFAAKRTGGKGFFDKFSQRLGRSRISGFRGRAGGFGK